MLLGLIASDAGANQIVPADCNLDFTNVYNPGDAVCVTGDVDSVPPGEICGAGYVYVSVGGSADPFFDISNPNHIPNYITTCGGGGGFIDEYVWLPPLMPGTYTLLLDEFPFGGGVVGAEDVLEPNIFVVTNAPLVFSVNPAMIKAAAVQGLAAAKAIQNLTLLLSILDASSTAADWAINFGAGGALAGIVLGLVCTGGQALELHDTDCPTSYNSAVIAIGNRILNGIAKALEKHYNGIIADPPDPNFLVVVPAKTEDMVAMSGPWTPLADHPIPNGQIGVASAIGLQAAAYQALLPALEKAQGASAANDHLGLLLQSEKIIAHAQLAIDAGERITDELDALEAHLAGAGQLGMSADIGPVIAQMEAGLDDADRAMLYSFGIDDAEIATAIADLSAIPIPGEVSWDALLAETRANVESMRPALDDLILQAQAVENENTPYALRIRPVASLTGPATGNVGVNVALTASATHENTNAVLSYAWDSDGDGAFDDGTGQTLDFLPTAPGWRLVTVEVSDGAAADYATHLVDVAVSNVAPTLTNLSPSELAPFAAVDEAVAFHAEATDADGDPVTLHWLVDDVEQATGGDFEFTMPDEEPHSVRVDAADDDPYSPDASQNFVVRSSKWQDEISGAGGNENGAGGNSNGSGGASADGDGGGCGCATVGASGRHAWLLLFVLGYALRRRRP